jgi:hypothetical protein
MNGSFPTLDKRPKSRNGSPGLVKFSYNAMAVGQDEENGNIISEGDGVTEGWLGVVGVTNGCTTTKGLNILNPCAGDSIGQWDKYGRNLGAQQSRTRMVRTSGDGCIHHGELQQF